MPRLTSILALAAGLVAGPALAAQAPAHVGGDYVFTGSLEVGAPGAWDYLTFAGGRLYLGHRDTIAVIDPAAGKLVGSVGPLSGSHGAVADTAIGRGFATSGEDGMLVEFDLATLAIAKKIPVGKDADGIVFDPGTGSVLVTVGDGKQLVIVDAKSESVTHTVDLPGAPEFPAADGRGKAFVNIASTSQMSRVDIATGKVDATWDLDRLQEPAWPGLRPPHPPALRRLRQRQGSGGRSGQRPCAGDAAAGRPCQRRHHHRRAARPRVLPQRRRHPDRDRREAARQLRRRPHPPDLPGRALRRDRSAHRRALPHLRRPPDRQWAARSGRHPLRLVGRQRRRLHPQRLDGRGAAAQGRAEAIEILWRRWRRGTGDRDALPRHRRAAAYGPPYVTDDPEPTDTGHWEIYNFVMASARPRRRHRRGRARPQLRRGQGPAADRGHPGGVRERPTASAPAMSSWRRSTSSCTSPTGPGRRTWPSFPRVFAPTGARASIRSGPVCSSCRSGRRRISGAVVGVRRRRLDAQSRQGPAQLLDRRPGGDARP